MIFGFSSHATGSEAFLSEKAHTFQELNALIKPNRVEGRN